MAYAYSEPPHIAVGPVNERGKVTAMLIKIKVDVGDQAVREIEYEDELDALKREWGVDEARGEGVLQLKKRK